MLAKKVVHMNKIDSKKELKHLYQPSAKKVVLEEGPTLEIANKSTKRTPLVNRQ